MNHVLALDAGGTKCEAVLLAPDGKALKFAACRKNGWTGRHPRVVAAACKMVLKGRIPDHLLLVVSDHPHGLPWPMLMKPRNRSLEVKWVPEYNAALRLADESWGAVVLCGTGAFVHIIDKSGKNHHYDGCGPLVGDFGGGFWIGQEALRATFRSQMHPRHSTSLERSVLNKLSNNTITRIQYLEINTNDRMTISSLAAVVDSNARAGDKISLQILDAAARELSETLFDALDQVGLRNKECALVATGSVLCRSDIVWMNLVDRVGKFAPRLRFIRLSTHPAVAGVALAGVHNVLDQRSYAEFRGNLLKSLPALVRRVKT